MKMERILPVLLVALPPIIVALVAKFIVGASSIIGAFNAVLGLLVIIPLEHCCLDVQLCQEGLVI